MSMFDRLIGQLKQRGLEVVAGEKPGQLLLRGPDEEKTPELLKALKAFRPLLLERFGRKEPAPAPAPKPEPIAEPEPEPEICRLCQRDVTDPEDRERLRGVNPFCDRGRAKAATDGNGVEHGFQERCPYRGSDS